MNDRLMIAAMAMQGMLASPDCIGDAQAVSGDAIECADALLAAAGEKEDHVTTAYHDSIVSEANALMVTWKQRAEAAESNLAARERERDQGKENLFTAECRLLDREKQIADLKRRMEPLTRDELIEDGAARKDWLGMTVTQTLALVNQADRIRARRA